MRNLGIFIYLLAIVSLHAKNTPVPILLPNGKPAKLVKVTLSKRSLITHVDHLHTKTKTFQCDKNGIIHLPADWTEPLQALVFDVPSYALHIQAYAPLQKIQLVKDGGIPGILVDKKGNLVKNTKICVSQGIGIIWGQIWIPKGINPAITNDQGEFTLRQMVLNDIKHYSCYADVVRIGAQQKVTNYMPSMKLQFSGPNYNRPKKAPHITLTQSEQSKN